MPQGLERATTRPDRNVVVQCGWDPMQAWRLLVERFAAIRRREIAGRSMETEGKVAITDIPYVRQRQPDADSAVRSHLAFGYWRQYLGLKSGVK